MFCSFGSHDETGKKHWGLVLKVATQQMLSLQIVLAESLGNRALHFGEKSLWISHRLFPAKNKRQISANGISHKVLTYLTHIMLWFESNPMVEFLLNQDFPFLSPSKSSIYEVKLLKRKSAQLFTTIGTKKKRSKEYWRIWNMYP